jgi:hypothetical protein
MSMPNLETYGIRYEVTKPPYRIDIDRLSITMHVDIPLPLRGRNFERGIDPGRLRGMVKGHFEKPYKCFVDDLDGVIYGRQEKNLWLTMISTMENAKDLIHMTPLTVLMTAIAFVMFAMYVVGTFSR